MRSLLGRFRRPIRRSQLAEIGLLNNTGDGSTLSLDFTTMSGLDSRFTFTRSSTATFINSSGLVQFANANLMTYSNPRQTGTAWGTVGTVTWGSSTLTDPTGGSNAQSVTFGTAASAMFNTSGTTVVSGITHTFSVWLRSATGTTTVRIGDANVAPVATVTLTTTWQRFSCQYTTSGTNDGGAIYSQTGTPSAEFYVWGAQVQPGAVVGDLIETSGTIDRNVPRFDHDPTTLAPRGLLLEGSATNIASRSQEWGASGWDAAASNTVSQTGTGAPDGTATSQVMTWTNGTASGSGYRQRNNISVSGSTAYTWSVWLKAGTINKILFYCRSGSFASSRQIAVDLSVNPPTVSVITGSSYGFTAVLAPTIQVFPNGWVRVVTGGTTQASDSLLWIGVANNMAVPASGTNTAEGWGLQLETGSGASSYIPTGAGTVQRAADSCVMTGANFSSWFNNATDMVLFCEHERPRKSAASGQDHGSVGTRYNPGNGLILYVSGSNLYGTTLFWPSGGAVFAGGLATAIPLVSKHACGVSGLAVRNFLNGSAYTSGTGTGTLTLGMLSIGANSQSGTVASRDWLNACVRRVKFWPYRLTDAQIQDLTS
jgi:hypothetical protein